jgi:hypothetical protein
VRSLCFSAGAATAIEGTNSFTFNLAANTGHSYSPPLQSAKSNHVSGSNDGFINAGQAYTPTGVAHGMPSIFVLISGTPLMARYFVSSGGWFELLPREFIWGR